MKYFKITDLGISISLVLVFGVLGCQDFRHLITGYFIVGGWQVVSMIVHAVGGWFNHIGSRRRMYHWITAITICLMPTGFIFYLLLFVAPVMAIYYSLMCYLELRALLFKELIHLK